MARKGYITPDNTARRVRQIYIGDETGKARRLKKVYLGVDDRAKLIMETRRYTITFNANGGSGSMNSIYCDKILESGEYVDFTAPASGFTRSGWQFLRWNTMPDGSGTTFRINETISINRDITLYAQWIELVKITWYKTAEVNWAAATIYTDLTEHTGPDSEIKITLSFPQDSTANQNSLSFGGYFNREWGRDWNELNLYFTTVRIAKDTVFAEASTSELWVPKGTVLNINLRNKWSNGGNRCAIYNTDSPSGLLAGPASPLSYTYTVNQNTTIRANWRTAGEYVPLGTEILNAILRLFPSLGLSATDNRDSWWNLHIF